MARNDGLDALIGLGILGAMMDSAPVKGVDTDTAKRHFNEKYGRKTPILRLDSMRFRRLHC